MTATQRSKPPYDLRRSTQTTTNPTTSTTDTDIQIFFFCHVLPCGKRTSAADVGVLFFFLLFFFNHHIHPVS